MANDSACSMRIEDFTSSTAGPPKRPTQEVPEHLACGDGREFLPLQRTHWVRAVRVSEEAHTAGCSK
jgi:hypothetical protein